MTYGPKVSRPFDSLITMKGTVGRVALVTDTTRPFVYSPQISYWRSLDPGSVYPRWLRYWLESPEFLSQASATKGATDMADYINLRDQRRMRIALPPPLTQQRIAAVLGAIDDLIENNRRRIDVLEQMAQAVYREWFVRFRYPGHEDATFVDSPLGPIPEGWKVAKSGDLMRQGLMEIGDGYRAKNAEMISFGEGLPFLRVANVRNGYLDLDGCDELPSDYTTRLKSKISRPGDSVIAMKGTVGRSALVDVSHPPLAYSPQVSFWRSLNQAAMPPSYIYRWIRSTDFQEQCAAVKGATDMADYVNLKDQRRMRLLVPDDATLTNFNTTAGPMLQACGRARGQISQLTSVRDLLLPKLVTGQVDVSHLDLDAVVGNLA